MASQRLDGWHNFVTGLGTALRDKRVHSQPTEVFLRQPEAELLWRGDDMAARIVEKIPRDALRRGFRVQFKSNDKILETANIDPDALDGLKRPEAEDDFLLRQPPETEQRPLGPGLVWPGPGQIPPNGGVPTVPGQPGATYSKRDVAEMKSWARAELRRLIKRGLVTMDSAGRLRLTRADLGQHVTDPEIPTDNLSDSSSTKSQTEALEERLKKLKVKLKVREAATFERAYGGAAIFLGTIDRSPGRSKSILTRPLDLDYIDELRFLTVLSPMEIIPYRYQGDPLAADYGEVEIWTMVPKSKGINPRGSIIRVHASRLIIMKGVRTSRFMVEAQRGFGDSVLNRTAQHIRNFSTAFDAASVLVDDFAQAIWKFKGLVEALQADGLGLIQKRAQAMEFVRSNTRAVVIDEQEEFERKSTSVTGLPELLDRIASRLAAATGMPVTMLMGEAPAGLNATGKADRDWYNENVSVVREDSVVPALERIVEVELHAKQGATKGKVPDSWSVQMPPLEEPTEGEMADVRLKTAQADQIYINTGVLHPEEVSESRFGGDEFSTHTVLNDEVRAAAREMQETDLDRQADLHEQQINPPEPAPGGPPKPKPPFGK